MQQIQKKNSGWLKPLRKLTAEKCTVELNPLPQQDLGHRTAIALLQQLLLRTVCPSYLFSFPLLIISPSFYPL